MEGYLGIDVGSVSTNLVIINRENRIIASVYTRTMGRPIEAVQRGMVELNQQLDCEIEIKGAGTTGSARYLTAAMVGADVVKNEITAHAVAAINVIPEVKTVIEIGGQDSKIILLQNKVVVDFAMNTVCAAGTGSFLDHQSARLGVPIEKFGELALKAKNGVQIAGRCSVFAESDMIHKQQMGYCLEEIVYGLCEALVRNYLNNLSKGKEILSPVVFQGGVAANAGMKRAFEEALNVEIIIPPFFNVMGAIGAAILAKEQTEFQPATNFRGFSVSDLEYKTSSFVCAGCSNTCEVVKIQVENETLARWGGRCGKWEVASEKSLNVTCKPAN
ncbi:MAG: 2-hydroxyglutaryl-CoA dehydratase [Actinobacteria bacterium]|nr:2-hydroxyglutaryl-CoA dehydratase [Actinomycetota bacterium]